MADVAWPVPAPVFKAGGARRKALLGGFDSHRSPPLSVCIRRCDDNDRFLVIETGYWEAQILGALFNMARANAMIALKLPEGMFWSCPEGEYFQSAL